jgi:D-alanyl-D-alanine dipeptidase
MKKICSVLFFVSVFSFFLSSCISINSEYKLINIQQLDSTIIVDVKYATENNFTGKILYQSSKAFLIEDAAKKLVKANQYLKENYGLKLKLYDGYRPLSVQKKMWEIIPDERYVANPQKGSRHNRGCAVDLTLIDSTGKELDMGTPYDDFSEKSHIDFFQLPDTVINNRKLLQEVMIKFGFIPLKTEWWHFDYKDWEKYPVLDIEIK